MDRTALLKKMFWNIRPSWHFRHHPDPEALSVKATVAGLQALLLADQGAMLAHTLQALWQRPVALTELDRLVIEIYQEGRDQRVWRAQATLRDGSEHYFGILVARAPGPSSERTRQDFANLQQLRAREPHYCVMPFISGHLPGGVAAYTAEWLDAYKELVFEITRDGGVFLVNAVGVHRVLSASVSRRIWRHMMTILWHYAGLQAVNIQAGDFVALLADDGTDVGLKLTTARDLGPAPEPAMHIQTTLGYAITASGYLSDGRRPFDRSMREEVFVHRMQAVLQRRFGPRAGALAQQQWSLFQAGAFARQEDGLKQDVILATYDYLRHTQRPEPAWQTTCQYWTAYAKAVEAQRLPPSWWFPAAEVSLVLAHLAAHGPLQ
jgi:hypothetical protein